MKKSGMKHACNWRLFVRVSITSTIASAPAHAQIGQLGSSTEVHSSPTSGEIVLTATRREASVQKVPAALTAYSGVGVQRTQITLLSDLAGNSPNLNINPFRTKVNVTLSGVDNTNIAVGTYNGVSVRADGAL